MKLKKFIKAWGPTIVWALLIFTMSARPSVTASQVYWQDFFVKKFAHITEYFIFANLMYRSLKISGIKKTQIYLVTFILVVLYAMTDETHQIFTPGREPRLRDVGFDTIGASLAILWIKYLLPIMPKKLLPLAKKLEMV